LFVGNLFFMTTMMIVLRAVVDEQKSLALSFASCITNIVGFIPAPIVFGAIIDSTCEMWNTQCETGNCIIYNNDAFNYAYHSGNAGFQLVAIIAIAFCYFKARSFTFPEDYEYDDDEISHNHESSPAVLDVRSVKPTML